MCVLGPRGSLQHRYGNWNESGKRGPASAGDSLGRSATQVESWLAKAATFERACAGGVTIGCQLGKAHSYHGDEDCPCAGDVAVIADPPRLSGFLRTLIGGVVSLPDRNARVGKDDEDFKIAGSDAKNRGRLRSYVAKT